MLALGDQLGLADELGDSELLGEVDSEGDRLRLADELGDALALLSAAVPVSVFAAHIYSGV